MRVPRLELRPAQVQHRLHRRGAAGVAASISAVLPSLSFAALSHPARASAAMLSASPLRHAKRKAVLPSWSSPRAPPRPSPAPPAPPRRCRSPPPHQRSVAAVVLRRLVAPGPRQRRDALRVSLAARHEEGGVPSVVPRLELRPAQVQHRLHRRGAAGARRRISAVLPSLSFAALSHPARASAAMLSASPLSHARGRRCAHLVPRLELRPAQVQHRLHRRGAAGARRQHQRSAAAVVLRRLVAPGPRQRRDALRVSLGARHEEGGVPILVSSPRAPPRPSPAPPAPPRRCRSTPPPSAQCSRRCPSPPCRTRPAPAPRCSPRLP